MRTIIRIDAANLVHNLNLFKKLSSKKVMFVVKANAYGHGLKEIVEITRDLASIDYYAVDSLAEALSIKAARVNKPVLVIGWSDEKELEELIRHRFETVIPSLEQLALADRIGHKLGLEVAAHIKIETGTARMGMEPHQAIRAMNGSRFKNIVVTGVYSHFANIEDTTDPTYAFKQLEIFNSLTQALRKQNVLRHFSCSASTLLFPETYFDMVRIGISAYGYWPSKQTFVSYLEKKRQGGPAINLKKVLSWDSHVAQVKELAKGSTVGYGLAYKTYNKAKIIIVPVGYYDGYDRRLSNISKVIVAGHMAPVRGRICMNMLMAEVTHIKKVRVGERVVLLGEENHEKIDADTLADLAGTINYEILCRLNPLIPRRVE